MLKFLIFFSFVISILSLQNFAPINDTVSQLPWVEAELQKKFSFHSGYALINSSKRNIHYFLATHNASNSSDADTTKPLILWLNGGPGCSSLIGMFQEIGPFVMDDGQKNFTAGINQDSWIFSADLLFLETPPGVGFSQNNDSNYNYTDNQTASDTYDALFNWLFTIHSEYSDRKLYIAGESYAGMYIPFLAHEINTQNNLKDKKINLKGILVGNGVTITGENNNLDVLQEDTDEFFRRHKFFSPILENELFNVCPSYPDSITCKVAQQRQSELLLFINPYSIYGYCYYNAYKKDLILSSLRKNSKKLNLQTDQNVQCQPSPQLIDYLKNKTVQEGLLIQGNQVNWTDCSDSINELYQMDSRGSLWIYQELMSKIKIWVYSGDTDGVVPTTHTERWIKDLENQGMKVTESWKPWQTDDKQVAGYITQYDGPLSYVTVRGAGHMVPQWRRPQAKKMLDLYLKENQKL